MNDPFQCADFRALMSSVRERPADDAPRGVIADWLRDNGDETWADFIDWQLRNPTLRLHRVGRTFDSDGTWINEFLRDKALAVTARAYALQARINYPVQLTEDTFETATYRAGWMPLSALTSWRWTWQRGFPARIQLAVQDGLDEVVTLLLEEWPIREVVVCGDTWRLNGETTRKFRARGVAWYTQPFSYGGPPAVRMTEAELENVRRAAARIDADAAKRLRERIIQERFRDRWLGREPEGVPEGRLT